jgi:signal recognition particle GTPase
MKKKNVSALEESDTDKQDNNNELNELNEFIRKKNIQNKVLKELIDQLKKYPVNNSKK